MIAPTLSRFEDAISKIIESEDVADIEQFMEELTSYGVTEISQLEDAYAGCYRDEATFCEDLMSDIYSSEMDALPTWVYHAIDWELVWHQVLRYDYFRACRNAMCCNNPLFDELKSKHNREYAEEMIKALQEYLNPHTSEESNG